jgi:rare lipoprotein A
MTIPAIFCNLRNRARTVLVALLFCAVSVPGFAMGPTREHPGETETGEASWYGADQGHRTASGERFDPHALTAAHRRLPFGTIIRVTNQLNGKSVDLRINDRGPWRGHRILDVSEEAANVLDMKRAGTVPVTIEIIKLGMGRHHHE